MTIDIANLERQRFELEANIQKLRESLYQWRLREAEYDGLKDEIASLQEDVTQAELLQRGLEFDGSVVDEKEVRALVFSGSGKNASARSRDQVVRLLDRRLDYVKDNVRSIEKRLKTAEDERDKLLGSEPVPVSGAAKAGGDQGVTEITEELDEEDNVISSTTSTPGDQVSGLSEALEVLKKAGVKDLPHLPPKSETPARNDVVDGDEAELKPELPSEEKPSDHPTKPVSDLQRNATLESNAEDGSNADEEPVLEVDESPEDAKLRREMLAYSLNEVGTVVAELEIDEEGSEFSVDDEEYDYLSEEYDDTDDEDEYGRTTSRVLTDEYHQKMRELEQKLNARGLTNIGRDTSVLPGEVRQELEEPIVLKVERESNGESVEQNQQKKQKKKVSFAAELDIAPAVEQPQPEAKPSSQKPKAPDVQPMSLSVVERTANSQPGDNQADSTTGARPKKVSKFKCARKSGADLPTETSLPAAPLSSFNVIRDKPKSSSESLPLELFPAQPTEPKPFSQPIKDTITENMKPANPSSPLGSHSHQAPSSCEPNPPEGKTLADKLVERDLSNRTVDAPDPDEIDEELHQKQIATEFYQMTNRRISQNGGFLENSDDESEIVPVKETNEEEPPRRVSRFMAARMKPMGS